MKRWRAIGRVVRAVAHVVRGLWTIRTQFGRFGRQVSGYALEHLAPERGRDIGRMLVGSEGTLALVHAAAGGVGRLLVQMITDLGGQVVATAGTD